MDTPRTAFNRDHSYKTAFNPDYLVPFFRKPMLPGDTINLKSTCFLRVINALFRPIMDNFRLYTYFWWVPNRMLWSNWMKFQGAQINPGDSVAFTVPVFTAYNPTAETLSDFFGVPPLAGAATTTHISLPWRAYNLIWNENYRDQNLQNSLTVDLGDGPDAIANYVLKKANKGHDYFTSALPFLQKGTAQTLGLSGNAPVYGIGPQVGGTVGTPAATWYDATGAAHSAETNNMQIGAGGWLAISLQNTGAIGASNLPNIYADLSGSGSVSINALRLALQKQAILELDARSGSRYAEIVEARFGVNFPDILYRPEYLGGSVVPISVSLVPQTSRTDDENQALGNLGAYAQAAMHGDRITKSFVEHGWVIGLMCVKADLNYQQGLERDLSVSTRYDYFEPLLSNIGEQAILNKEIYLQGSANPTQDIAVFGYQEAWGHDKYGVNLITGRLRSTHATPLDMYHLAQEFGSLPTLGSTFITETMPIDRILTVATASEPAFAVDVYHDFKHVRPIPAYSIPGLLPRF